MRKFKLLKKYPALPINWESGLEIVFKGNNWYMPEDKSITQKSIHSEEVENYPEFWEEVTPPTYEILEFQDIPGNRYYKQSNGRFTINTTYEYDLEEMIANNYSITRIKRLSDGEIVQQGDIIGKEGVAQRCKIHKITPMNIILTTEIIANIEDLKPYCVRNDKE